MDERGTELTVVCEADGVLYSTLSDEMVDIPVFVVDGRNFDPIDGAFNGLFLD